MREETRIEIAKKIEELIQYIFMSSYKDEDNPEEMIKFLSDYSKEILNDPIKAFKLEEKGIIKCIECEQLFYKNELTETLDGKYVCTECHIKESIKCD